jgi:arginine exporter protein ArgO
LTIGGSVFVGGYGTRALLRARRPQSPSKWVAATGVERLSRGAACASGIWFTSLGFGARLLSPWFARPRAWQILDTLVGATMLVIATLLVHQAIRID